MIVQLAEAGTVPAVTLNEFPPAVAEVVTPEQVPPTASGVALSRPAGYASVKLTPVSAIEEAFVIVSVNWLVPLA